MMRYRTRNTALSKVVCGGSPDGGELARADSPKMGIHCSLKNDEDQTFVIMSSLMDAHENDDGLF